MLVRRLVVAGRYKQFEVLFFGYMPAKAGIEAFGVVYVDVAI